MGIELEKLLENEPWQKLEKVVQEILEQNNFETKLHYRLKNGQEIDILAQKDSIVLCVECKKLGKKYNRNYKLKLACRQLKNKMKTLANKWNKKIVGVVVTLWPDLIVEENIYVIPIFALNEWLKTIEDIVFK